MEVLRSFTMSQCFVLPVVPGQAGGGSFRGERTSLQDPSGEVMCLLDVTSCDVLYVM